MPQNLKTFFALMTTFYNFSLKLGTSGAKKVVKSILKTWNATNVIVCVWFIIKIWNVKKNNSKRSKITKKS